MPDKITTCSIAHFVGYVDDIRDIQHDPTLESDIKSWVENHPEYEIHTIKYEQPGSSGYPLEAAVYYKEMTYGRSHIAIKHGEEENLFTLRNITTGHIIRLRRYDRNDKTTRVILKDKEGTYIIEERLKL